MFAPPPPFPKVVDGEGREITKQQLIQPQRNFFEIIKHCKDAEKCLPCIKIIYLNYKLNNLVTTNFYFHSHTF